MPQGYSSGAASASSTERWGHLRARFGASSASPAALSYSSNDAQARGLSRIPKPVCQTPSSAVSCLTCCMARSLLRGDPVVQVVSNWTGWSETSTPAVTQWPLSQALHSNRNDWLSWAALPKCYAGCSLLAGPLHACHDDSNAPSCSSAAKSAAQLTTAPGAPHAGAA